MATLARDGRALTPRLFLMPVDPSPRKEVDLQISEGTLLTILEGLDAVVNETHGTAYETFQESGFAADRVRAYGKTGSTEGPANAWFAGFAKDDSGRGIALAVVVEGGQSGSRDAAPLGRKIMRFCINRGYVGHQIPSGDSL